MQLILVIGVTSYHGKCSACSPTRGILRTWWTVWIQLYGIIDITIASKGNATTFGDSTGTTSALLSGGAKWCSWYFCWRV